MLDDLKYIHSKDPQDALGAATQQTQQLRQTYAFTAPDITVDNVVFAGIGGSGLWALMSLTWPGYTVPFEIWRRYDAPSYLGKNTLLIANSFSGGTEETLSAVAAAEAAGSHIIAVASGGKLIEIAQEKGYPYIQIPASDQPRFGTLSGFMSLITIMHSLGLTQSGDDMRQLEATADLLDKHSAAWQPDVPSSSNPAKQLALELAGTSPVIYAGRLMYPSAYKWKMTFNETAKNVSWCNELPEFSHNEFTGWTVGPVEKPYSVVDLRSTFEHPRIQKRFEVTNRLLSGKRPHPHTVTAVGDSPLDHMLYTNVFGDFVAIYLALLNGVDPTPVDLVNTFKKALDS